MTQGRQLCLGSSLSDSVPAATTGPAIHSACWHGSVEVVQVLLEFRADLEAPEDGRILQNSAEFCCWPLHTEAKEPKMDTPPLNTAIAVSRWNRLVMI